MVFLWGYSIMTSYFSTPKEKLRNTEAKLYNIYSNYSILEAQLNDQNLTDTERKKIMYNLAQLAKKSARTVNKRNELAQRVVNGGKTKKRKTSKKQRKTKNRKA